MANAVGGSIVWNLDIDDKQFNAKLAGASAKAQAASSSMNSALGNVNFASFASNAASAFDSVARGLGKIVLVGAAAGTGLAIVLSKATGAAFEQVRAVENASFALRAYEKDGTKVTRVLGELVAFARSDMGVLFKREELFKAASNLRGFGEASETLTDKVKVLARGVSLGMITFDEFSQVVGRAASKGRLDADQYDILAGRGIILDKAFRGAAVSSEGLFKELQRVLPAELLQGRANTIDGVMIRLESAFRDLGSAILGVDKDTSQFVKGGLGDTLIQSLNQVREALKDPALLSSLKSLGQGIGTFVKDALPVVIDGFQWLVSNSGTIAAVFVGIAAGFVAAKIAAIAFGIASNLALGGLPLLFGAIAVGVTALVGLVAGLQTKFGTFTPVITAAKDAFTGIWNAIQLLITGNYKGGIFGLSEDSLGVSIILKLRDALIFVKDVFAQLFSFIATQATPLIDMIKNSKELQYTLLAIGGFIVGAVITPFLALGAAILAVTAIIGGVLFVVNKVVGVFQAIQNSAKVSGEATKAFFESIGAAILNFYNAYIAPIVTPIVSTLRSMYEGIYIILSTLFQIWVTIWQGIFKYVTDNILTPLRDFVAGIFQSIYNVIIGPLSAVVNFIRNKFNEIQGAIANPLNNALNTVRNIIGGFVAAGRDLISGLLNGIANNAHRVVDKIREICANALGAVKKFFGIQSPSKVMAGIGSDLMAGMTQGIVNSTRSVVTSAQNAAESVLGGFGSITPTLAPNVAGSGYVGANTTTYVTNVTQNNSGIVARSRSEWRELNKDGIESINEELRSKGLPELGGGLIGTGGSTI